MLAAVSFMPWYIQAVLFVYHLINARSFVDVLDGT